MIYTFKYRRYKLTVYEKVEGRIAGKGYRHEDLANFLNVTTRTVSQHLKEIKEGDYKNLYRYLTYLGFEIDLIDILYKK